MKWILAMIALSGPAAGQQQLTVDPAIVRACFADTPPDEMAPLCVGSAANDCQNQPDGSTTLGISECLLSEAATWEVLLYEQDALLTADFAAQDDGPSLNAALLGAQEAWRAFRTAECGLTYTLWLDGSHRFVAAAECQLTMTAQRSFALRDMRGN